MTDAQNWYAFRAYNSQVLYGYGTSDDADEYCDILNERRDVNVYSAFQVADYEATEMRLDENSEAFNLDDELAARKGLR